MRHLQQTYLLILGRAALLSLSSVWSLKKMLRRLALSVSSEYMIPSCSKVGMEEFVVQSNFNGSNTHGTMKISSRQG